MQTDQNSGRGCGCLLVALGWLLGGALLVVGLAWGYRSFTVQEGWAASQGVVIDLQPNTDAGSDTYAPVVEYQTSEGVDRVFTHNVYSRSWDVGDAVDVRYDPDDPSNAVVYSAAGFWVGPAAFTAVGVLVLIVTIILRAVLGRRSRRGGSGTSLMTLSGPRRPAEFRRVETDIDGEGTFRWRIVARGEDGAEYRSGWYDEDPQMDLMNNGYAVELVQHGDRWVVVQA